MIPPGLAPFERVILGFWPTPLVRARSLGDDLGIDLWFKRDDLSGLALGGNKARKLEFLLAEARAQGCDCLLTAGAAQSNHCRQTAAAAAIESLECHLALGGRAPDTARGNLVLDLLFGAHLHWCGDHRKGEDIPALAEELERAGKKPFVVPYGGSNVTGALGFVSAAAELIEQCDSIDLQPHRVVFASSSGGTQAGLVAGMRAMQREAPRITGIRVDKTDATPSHTRGIAALARDTLARLGVEVTAEELAVELHDDALGAPYGEVTAPDRRALLETARTEGILLDPVYTARAMAGLRLLIDRGIVSSGERVIFWHTGGAPALFAGEQDLLGDA